MRTFVAFALVLLPALPALAGGRTFALATVINNGTTKLNKGETSITVRSPRTSKVSMPFGNGQVPVARRLNTDKTQALYTLGKNSYFVSPDNVTFQIK